MKNALLKNRMIWKLIVAHCSLVAACASCAAADFVMDRSVMSEKYWEQWNGDVQAKIDADIEKFRKADCVAEVAAAAGTEVKVEQVSHAFFFGAQIFCFNQLGTVERNDRYKALYNGEDIFARDALFNSATVAFYWKTLEPYKGQIRYSEDYRDTEAFWNQCAEPWLQPNWRRPPVEPVIDFLRSRGLRIHGHPLCWGNNAWQTPSWIWDEYCPASEKRALAEATGVKLPSHDWSLPMGVKEFGRDEGEKEGVASWPRGWENIFAKLSEEEVAKLCPTYFAKFNELTFARIGEIAARYGDRVDSWDVCNESSIDFHGASVTGKPFQKSPRFGITAGDLCYNAFKESEKLLPKSAWLNINDYAMGTNYVAQVKDLVKNGCRIDVVGSQMHLFDPVESDNIARGEGPEHMMYKGIAERFEMLAKADRPIHLSEITITAPDNSPRGQMVQAIIARNCYRAWFSVEKMNGITWWNLIDNCGAPGEPSISGLFTRDMRPKTAFYALQDLVQREWRTLTSAKVEDGKVRFRGFRGRYRLTWSDASGEHVKYLDLN